MKLKLSSTVKYNFVFLYKCYSNLLYTEFERGKFETSKMYNWKKKIESLELNMRVLESQIIAAEVITADPVENMVQ